MFEGFSSLGALTLNPSEIIPHRLYFTSLDGKPPITNDTFYFSIDDSLVYENFCLDFGPLNLAHTYHFCKLLKEHLNNPEHNHKRIYFYSSPTAEHCSNAAVLIGCFSILCLGKTSKEAYGPLEQRESSYCSFHDASFHESSFRLTVQDCLDGVYRAQQLKFFDWERFNVEEYERYIDLDNGDLNWLVDGKFGAFAGPFEKRKHFGHGYYSTIPSDYISYFHEKGVTAVIRLNKICYHAKHFTDNGINHYHLFYPDGGNPPEKILQQFISICEKEKGAIAVHCKAGLGRTGTCIGMYLMKHYNISAIELIGWFRIVRPGTVIGPQQQYLVENEFRIKEQGKLTRKQSSSVTSKKRESSPQKNDTSRSFTELKLVNNDDLYLNLHASKKSSESFRISFTSREGIGDTQGDILNRKKAENRKKTNA